MLCCIFLRTIRYLYTIYAPLSGAGPDQDNEGWGRFLKSTHGIDEIKNINFDVVLFKVFIYITYMLLTIVSYKTKRNIYIIK